MLNHLTHFIFFVILISTMPVFAQSKTDSAYLLRCESVIKHYQKLPYAKDAFRALAKIKTQTDLSTAYQILDSLTAKPQGDVFWLYPMTAIYLHCYKELPESYRNKMRQTFQTYTPLRGDTENHWCMYYASLYLLGEKEKTITWFNGKTSQENVKESKEWLSKWINTTTNIGQGEFDSPLYGIFFIAPLVMLRDLAEDKNMKKSAENMLYWLLADFFVDYLDGIYTGANSRIYEYDIFSKRKTLMSNLANFLLGDKPLPSPIPQLLLFAFSDFRLPEILRRIALDRTKAYENKERKRSRDRIRYDTEKNPMVARYTYMSKNFSLGSIQRGKTEEILQHTWQLCWREHTQGEITTFFGLHPHFSAKDMGSLFPSLPKEVVKEIASSKTSYPKSNKWVGASPYEDLFQYKNTLLCLYDFSDTSAIFKEYNLFFSKDIYKEISTEHWIFAKHDFVFIALKPLVKLNLVEQINTGEKWQMNDVKGGFVLYVEEPENFTSFEGFKRQIMKTFEIQYNSQVLSVKTPQSDKLSFAYKGARTLNGKKVLPEKYPLFENPFMKAKKGNKKLIMKYKKMRLVLKL